MEIQKTKSEVLYHYPHTIDIDFLIDKKASTFSGSRENSKCLAHRLNEWCKSAAGQDWAIFGERILLDGLRYEELIDKLSKKSKSSKDVFHDPIWKNAVWIYASLTWPSANNHDGDFLNLIFKRLVMHANKKALRGIQIKGQIKDGAVEKLTQNLIADILSICHESLLREMESYAGNPSATGFETYIQTHGWKVIFQAYPVILRLISSVVSQWIEGTRELILRITTDFKEIVSEFFENYPQIHIIDFECNISDKHNFGRFVYILKFSNDQKIVYKPRDQHIEQQWTRLVKDFNSKSSINLKLPRILPKSEYGWSEFIKSENCSNTSDLSLFYTRAGIWAGLLYCLCGSDMHSDNIILNGDQPVLIDLEMSILPCIRPKSSKYTASAESVALELRNSVLSVGILPWFMTDTNTSLENRGGVMLESGHYEGSDNNINSGLLHFKGEFISGFEKAMYYIITSRSSPCFQSILFGFCGLKIRVAFKHTRFYWNILQRLKKIENLTDGIGWSAHADFVSRIWDWDNLPRAMWKINRHERIALYDLNIPVFNVQTESKEIHSNKEIVFKISQSGFSRVKNRINRVTKNEIERQKTLIETTLGACSPGAKKIVMVEYKKNQELAALSDNDILLHCHNLHKILALNCVMKGVDVNWISLTSSNKDADISNLGPLGLGVYSGIGGVAIAYASMYEVTQNDEFRKIANRALSPIINRINGKNLSKLVREVGIGIASGVSSMIYSLCYCFPIIDRQDNLDSAVDASRHILDSAKRTCSTDLLDGIPGAILAMVKLYETTLIPEVLNHAYELGEILFNNIDSHQVDLNPNHPNSFYHGRAGVSHAFFELTRVTGEQKFSECGLVFNDVSNFIKSYLNRKLNSDDFRYCTGFPGIISSVLSSSNSVNLTGDFHDNWEDLVQKALLANNLKLDTICCGNLGIVNFLLDSARHSGKDKFAHLARMKLSNIFHEATSSYDFHWGYGDNRFNVNLFRGLSGVLFTAMRCIAVRRLPSVTMWE